MEKIKKGIKNNSTTIILVVLLIIAASWGGSQYAKAMEYQRALDNMYELSYYELVGSLENIDVDISKLTVSSSPGDSLELLSSISRKCDFAVSSLSNLPLSHPASMDTMQFLNTLGDYCRSLVKSGGEHIMLSEEDYTNFSNFRQSCVNLRTTLDGVTYSYDISPDKNWEYYQMVSQDNYDPFTFEQNGGIEYPSIIYDGPFSDALIGATAKGLSASTCTQDEALQIAAAALNEGYDTLFVSAQNSKNIDGYSCSNENGDTAFISNTGDVIWMMKDAQSAYEKLNYSECVVKAEEYLNSMGIKDMVDTWSQTYNGQCVISFAYTQNNCIVYPDLIKVKVNTENGDIVAYDALGYFMNHCQRDIPQDTISKDEAQNTVLGTLDVVDSDLCYIPSEGGDETLCWEFECLQQGEKYLVYVNALDGIQERIYKVVETTDGELTV